MKQSSVKIKIVNIITVLTLIIFTFFTGSAVAEVNVATNEPTQNTEMNKDTNYNGPTGESRQLPAGQAEYTEEFYYQQLDRSYLLVKTETKVGTIGETVTLIEDTLTANTAHYTEFWQSFVVEGTYKFRAYNHLDYGLSKMTGIVEADGSLVLKMYLSRQSAYMRAFSYTGIDFVDISPMYGGTYTVPVPPYREGCEFSHWVRYVIRGRNTVNANQSTATVTGCETLFLNEYGNDMSQLFTGPSRLEPAELDGLWHDYLEPSLYWPVYVTAPPTPAPITTPIPTPNPGRTCQDDGYGDGYYWDGNACVLPQVYVVPNTAAK